MITAAAVSKIQRGKIQAIKNFFQNYKLLQNIKVQPYTSGSTIVRTGFLSAILAIKVGTAGDLKITVTHGDTDAAADVVTDELIFPEAQTEGGVFEVKNVQASDIVNIDVDLLGLKDYVKFKNILIEFKKFYDIDEYNLRDIDKYLWIAGKEYFPKKYKYGNKNNED